MNDVASPIDLRNYDDAVEWQDTANVKRPWRKDFFDYYANLIKMHASDQGHILELGAGPGFLAQHLLSQLPNIQYTAFDFSEAMHQLAQQKLTPSERARANYLIGNFKEPDWENAVNQKYDFIIIHQALHELRHKKYAADFHKKVKTLLEPQGCYLVCDHLCAPHAMQNDQLYMNKQEHIDALKAASFENIKMPLEIEGLCLFEMRLD
ncbi:MULTISPECIES: class I SAM-dependent methyltransferase [Acinetobacter]|uniref:class I SAM-dependent methyltransferase n=1 Tax=Acinetobacter TaxID=469 RepID=UPI00244D02F9|nr:MULTISPECIES: class I SAM-dependent methyltransferase [Acinetobacter]MDH0030298.1 class I SAM-dependent methyltransferase [Acinetobacter sp. GD04021]MDH0885866.1 class I SAM-dependent methyltransferase [Acinetobacter sp. GD03873]MDH1082486.1 class I SAM-dependent methyltransferase [Acinetobacter sp. GD03983]MDH2189122.1 class I SAM-dependent methyltransferase [Acinetobacter sp. GD03645]MDH2202310.1 class I SAM-dependent methyltransferase [Acinetobacter sp. GD03647]